MNKIENVLFSGGRGTDKQMLLDQYKIYLELADKVGERRQNANSFCMGINAALLAAVGFIYSKDAEKTIKAVAVFIPIAGILVSIFWMILVTSYRQLNAGKFKVVHELEQKLQASPYHAEWIALGEGKCRQLYIPITHVEVWIPVSMVIAHIILFCILVAGH